MQRQQALLSQQLREQHAHIEQAKPLVALLVTGVAHKVPEACCCTVAGTSVMPDKGTCSRCCSSTHAREPAHGLDGVCWRPSCMSSLCRSLLISVQCGFVLLSRQCQCMTSEVAMQPPAMCGCRMLAAAPGLRWLKPSSSESAETLMPSLVLCRSHEQCRLAVVVHADGHLLQGLGS